MNWSGFFNAAAEGVGGFVESHYETRASNAVRRRQNENAKITGAHNAGIISQNAARVREEATTSRIKLQRARAKARSSAAVSAAFAGVQGGSVDASQFAIARGAAERFYDIQTGAEAELANSAEQSYQNKVNTVLSQQTMLAGPSLVGAALGILGTHLADEVEDTGSGGLGQPERDTGFGRTTIFNLL